MIAGGEHETDMLQQLRLGSYHLILPETLPQFYAAVESLSMRKIQVSRPLVRKYFKVHLRTVNRYKQSILIDSNVQSMKSLFDFQFSKLSLKMTIQLSETLMSN